MSRRYLIMDIEGPTMSFGGPQIDALPDEIGFPTASMLTGLIGNALGLTRADGIVLNAIQASMEMSVATIRSGKRIVDFQTVDLGKPHMVGPMWTLRGKAFEREGSGDALARQVRYRPLLADAHFVCAVAFGADAPYTAERILEALREPARPLFIGRVGNIPTSLVGHSVADADDPESAIRSAGFERIAEMRVPSTEGIHHVPGLKDFRTGIHSGTQSFELTRPA